MKKINFFYILFISLIFSSCFRVEDKLEPKFCYQLEESEIDLKKNPFKTLSDEEKKTDWAKEYIIAKNFAKELDLYRAITNFKRAKILLEDSNLYRRREINYYLILTYFLAKKYEDVIEIFNKSTLDRVDKTFETYHDLLIILYESYNQLEQKDKSNRIHELLEEYYPNEEKKVVLSSALIDANISKIEEIALSPPPNEKLINLVNTYYKNKKSVASAQILNAILPGSGYLYIGQKKSAVTALLLNASFIYASYEFFKRGYTAAGIITVSFEAGWYFGGIYGAGEEARFYNERLYECMAAPVLKKEKLFPIFMLNYGF
jgi:tetratricopeptide (TPR) repeat protein